MRVSAVLYSLRMRRMIKFHWHIQGRLKVYPTPSESILKSCGYEVVDINEVLNPPKEKPPEVIGLYDEEPPLDENHPLYKNEPCYIHKDEDLLLDGLTHAKRLTNTVEITDGLPDCVIESESQLNLPEEIHSDIKKRILLSCTFEASQEKLPKRKDPLRPAWQFPRDYGIIDKKKNEFLCKNLLTICEQFGNNVQNKPLVSDGFFSVPFEAHNKKIQFQLTSELIVTKAQKLKALETPSSTYSIVLPDLSPLSPTVSLRPYHFYNMENIYPFKLKSKWPYVQLAFVHYNATEVKNLFEKEVLETQILSRSLMKGFCIAAAQARALFGSDVKNLPEPIVVPVVQTDGKMFHFVIFQLNTLEIDQGSEVKNIFWNSQRIPLYETCEYVGGRPVLKNYNPQVIRKLVTFYNIE